jgi:hypothetical protein
LTSWRKKKKGDMGVKLPARNANSVGSLSPLAGRGFG